MRGKWALHADGKHEESEISDVRRELELAIPPPLERTQGFLTETQLARHPGRPGFDAGYEPRDAPLAANLLDEVVVDVDENLPAGHLGPEDPRRDCVVPVEISIRHPCRRFRALDPCHHRAQASDSRPALAWCRRNCSPLDSYRTAALVPF